MIRFSRKSLYLFGKILNENSQLIIDHRNCRAVIKIPHSYVKNVFYSNVADSKNMSPIGNLIAKDVASKNQPQGDDEKKNQRERSWRKTKLTLAIFGMSFACLGAYLVATLGPPELDEHGKPIKDDLREKPVFIQYLIRTYRELDFYRKLIREPSREKLLPDPLGYPYLQPKYTLVIEFTDVLVHPDWTYNTGWRFKKRPLLDYFLETLQGSYEIIIYTAEQGMTVFPIVDAIDPKNIIAYKLVRDATYFSGGHHVKSLNNLNRDLSKVICVDWNPKNVKFNPDNLFLIKRWNGNDDDTSLLDLATLLKTIADNDIEDVREVMRYYRKYDDPIQAFVDKQKRLIADLDAQALAKREQEASKVSRWIPSIFKKKSST